MTNEAKLSVIKMMLNISNNDKDAVLTAYLESAKNAIIAWVYGETKDYNSANSTITDVPKKYEQTQIDAVIAGYSQSGNEGQTEGTENGITRKWKYADMLHYIKSNCIPITVLH